MFREFFQKKKKGNEHSSKLIYEMFYSHVYKTAYFIIKDPHTAQDIVQETFIKVFQNLHKLDDGSKMKPWISTIATRTAIDFIRKQKRGNKFDIDTVNNIKNVNELAITVEEEVERSFVRELVREEIGELAPEYRSVLYLKYIQDMKDQEIANHLNLNVGTVKTRVHRAKNQLKKKLQKSSVVDGEVL